MKNKMMILVEIICVFFIGGCGLTPDSYRPVDDISREIEKEVGEDFFFYSRKVLDDDSVLYLYRTLTFDAERFKDFYDICNEVCPEDEKVTFGVCLYLAGGSAPLFYIQNYNDDDMYDGLYYLWIGEQAEFIEATCDPTLYSLIEGIKEIHVDSDIQEKADDMGIDWYSYWPDLEKVVVEER